MLYGSVTWCYGLNEVGILQRTERAMVRSMCAVKLMDKNSTKDLMHMLHSNDNIDQMVRTNSVRWNRHVLRLDWNNFLRLASDIKVKGT